MRMRKDYTDREFEVLSDLQQLEFNYLERYREMTVEARINRLRLIIDENRKAVEEGIIPDICPVWDEELDSLIQ